MPKPMAHVFIVDERTFPVHLEYQFAGTTAGPSKARHIGLYADIARVRPGHRAYFYLLRQGFYGPFLIDPDNQGVWWDPITPTYLQDRLGRRLIYRVRVVPNGTYPLGISEWDSLDRYLRDPDRCLWSLVYRKLKGERGCTMIFPWEDDFLLELIRQRNEQAGRGPLVPLNNTHLTWDAEKSEITIAPGAFSEYAPENKQHITPPDNPVEKLRLASGSESHIQAYLTQGYGHLRDTEIIFGPTGTLSWVGNEVACGLGMQKIDLFAINGESVDRQFRLIELKKDPPTDTTVGQLERYIDWTKRFVPDANAHNIQPVLLCRNLKNQPLASKVVESFHRFNDTGIARSLKYIECLREREGGGARFCRVAY